MENTSSPLVHIIGFIILGIISAFNTWQSRRHGNALEQVKKTGNSILTLSNGRLAATLLTNVQFSRQNLVLQKRIAELSKDRGDEAAALAAELVVKQQEALLNAHLEASAQVELAKLQSLRKV